MLSPSIVISLCFDLFAMHCSVLFCSVLSRLNTHTHVISHPNEQSIE